MAEGELYFPEGVNIKKWGGTKQSGADLAPLLQSLITAVIQLNVTMQSAGLDIETLQPIARASLHNEAVTADTDILGSPAEPERTPCLFRVMACFDAAGALSTVITNGGDSQVVKLNSGNDLAASALYIFDLLIDEGDSVNFRYSVNANLKTLRVQEIDIGVQ
jgi:hypothetical protein